MPFQDQDLIERVMKMKSGDRKVLLEFLGACDVSDARRREMQDALATSFALKSGAQHTHIN